jgi:multimeric flavodoxin WrbA
MKDQKIVAINGSPRENGSTGFLINKIIEGIGCKNVKRYCLGTTHISYCLGCKECHATGSCAQADDMDAIIADIIDATLIIIGSPSYWGGVTGQLKVFFDRSTPYSETNPNEAKTRIPEGKKGISIAVRAGSSKKENESILDSIEHYFGHLGIDSIGRFGVSDVDTLEDLLMNRKEIDKALKFGERIRAELD